jgi:hypothetical protein
LIKPLIAYFHAVDLESVRKAIDGIKQDTLYISYFEYPYPHRIAQKYFMEHQEYTHLIMVPNDLEVHDEHINKILEMVEAFDYQVCCGVCNVDTEKYNGYWNVTSNLPDLEYVNRRYKWLSKGRYPNMIIQVPFAGFPAMCIRRDVLEKCKINEFITPNKTNEAPIWETKGGYSNDLIFCHNLNDLHIPIMANTGIIMNHYRYGGINQIGKKPKAIKFIKAEDK